MDVRGGSEALTILNMRKIRFGVQLRSTNSPAEWRALIKRAEELGYSSLSLPDHIDEQYSPISALSFAAALTSSISVATLVLSNDFRHPLILAREMATLASLCKGRVEFGLGAGWLESDYIQLGMKMDSASVRIDRLREALRIVSELFSTGKSDFSGVFYSLGEANLHPFEPAFRPKVVVGGGGKKILDIAAEFADIVGVNPKLPHGRFTAELVNEITQDSYEQKCEYLFERLAVHGRSVELQCRTVVARCEERESAWLEDLAASFGVEEKVAREMPPVLVGTHDYLVEMIEARREKFGINYWVIHQDEMEQFAPVVASLVGR